MLFSFTTTKTFSDDDGDEYVHSIEATPTYSMLIDRVNELTKQLEQERRARMVLEQKFLELIEAPRTQTHKPRKLVFPGKRLDWVSKLIDASFKPSFERFLKLDSFEALCFTYT